MSGIMENSLTAYSNKEEIATSHKAFRAYIDVHSKINSQLSEIDILMIRECIEEDKITVGELDKAIIQAYKDPERYGKVEWNHVWKWVKINREEFNPEIFQQRKGMYR